MLRNQRAKNSVSQRPDLRAGFEEERMEEKEERKKRTQGIACNKIISGHW